jgi:hypothetical protein
LGMIAWALGRIGGPHAKKTLSDALSKGEVISVTTSFTRMCQDIVYLNAGLCQDIVYPVGPCPL